MSLSETARQRLKDVRELQPTTNGELQERWGMDSGREVAEYLRTELSTHTYRDDDSRIRAVAENGDADALSDGDGADESDTEETTETPNSRAERHTSLSDADTDLVEMARATDHAQSAGEGDVEPADGPDDPQRTGLTDESDPAKETPQLDPPEPETDPTRPVDDESDEAIQQNGCPECGGELVDAGGGVYQEVTGAPLHAEPGDDLCPECGLIVDANGSLYSVIPSSEAESPDDSNRLSGGLLAAVITGVVTLAALVAGNRTGNDEIETF